jgi:PEP-CTERM motif
MKTYAIAAAVSLAMLGSAQADTLYEASGFSLAAQAAPPGNFVQSGSSMGVETTFLLAQRSTVQRVVFVSSLGAAALDPGNHHVLPSVSIFDQNWGLKGSSSGFEAAATVAPGPHLNDFVEFNLVDFSVGQLTLDAGTYRITWSGGDSMLMPVYPVPGESVTVSNPLDRNTFADTSLAFQVQGVAVVPEASTLAMMLGGLGLLCCATARRRRA